jgi:hypothetical protein
MSKDQYKKKKNSTSRSEKGGKFKVVKSIQNKRKQLTSSIKGVEEQPDSMVGSLVDSNLAFFGEGARGLTAGVGCSRSCWGGEVSSPSG